MPVPPGQRLGPYEVLSPIGAGGMGEVYRAKDTRLGREVAIKVLPAEFARDPERLHRFEQEARAAAALNHPNILVLYDIGTHEGAPYIVTELLEGETLRRRLRGGPLPPAKAVELGVQIAQGLSAAHEKGIVHRDLKPENVFLTKDDRPKILDFGLARLLSRAENSDPTQSESPTADSPTREGRVLGTPGYMSPEQVRGAPADGRTDIFAFGALMYEALSGARAFAGHSSPDIQAAILKDDPPPLPRGVPPTLQAVVRRCLQKRPEDRFQSAQDTCFALQSTYERPSFQRFRFPPPKWPSRRALWWTTGGTAVIAIALAAILWRVFGGSASIALPSFHPRRVTSGSGIASEPAVSPSGTEIAYTHKDGGNTDIWVTDIRGGTPLRLTTRAAKDFLPAWFPDGTTLAFASDEGGTTSIWTIQRFGGTPMLLVPNASCPAISPDGKAIAFSRANPDGYTRIWVAPLSDVGQARALTGDADGHWDHSAPAWSPDGSTLCYRAQPGLRFVPSGGGPVRPFTLDQETDEHPTWSPDGRHVYFSSFRDGTHAIWRQPVRGGAAARVTIGTGPEVAPSLSRDGRLLAYTTESDSATIALIDLKSGERTLLRDAPEMLEPAFAPDDSAMLYVSDKAGTYDLWKQPLKEGRPSGAPQRLTAFPGNCVHPVYSPDGRWIAFYRVSAGQRDIWVMPSSGGTAQNFTSHPARNVQPEWSPDGHQLAYASDRGGTLQLWVAPVSEGLLSGEPRQVTSLKGTVTSPAWSPDGERIAFIVSEGSEGGVWVADASGRTSPRALVRNCDPIVLVWSRSTGKLLASGSFGAQTRAIWEVPLDGSPPTPFVQAKPSGPDTEIFDFDLSVDGRFLALQEFDLRGDIWVLESQKGKF